MNSAQESAILRDVFVGVTGALGGASEADNELVRSVMRDRFVPHIIDDLFGSPGAGGVSFPAIRSAFSYFYTKSIDAVLIQAAEEALVFGINVLHSSKDLKAGRCGISQHFLMYGADPNAEYAHAECAFEAFQDVCVRYRKELATPGLAAKMVTGALLAILPYGIARGKAILRSCGVPGA